MRRLFSALLLALALPVHAQKADEFNFPVDHFQGEDTYQDSARLKPNQAQDTQNVLTEHGYIEKRPGSSLSGTCPSGAVENMTEFVKLGGTRLMAEHCGSNLYWTDFGETPVNYSTVAASSNVSFVKAFNKIISVDGQTQVEFDGNSTTTAAGFPQCNFLEYSDDRIWCAAVVSESLSRVRISSVANDTGWVVPANPNIVPNAPNLFDINRDDGQNITCVKKTPWGVAIGKNRSMWVVKGTDNSNYYVRNIDPAIGCVDNRSMQMVDGRLEWLAADGVYSWSGAVSGATAVNGALAATYGGGALSLESLPIDPIIKTIRQANSQKKSWALQSLSDWQSGFITVNGATQAALSPIITPGSLVPSSATLIDNMTIAYTSGTLINISTLASSGNNFSNSLSLAFTTNSVYSSTPTWQLGFNADGGIPIYTSSITIAANIGAGSTTEFSTFTVAYGTFNFSVGFGANNFKSGFSQTAVIQFIASSSNTSGGGGINTSGYGIQFNSVDGTTKLCRYDLPAAITCNALMTLANYTQSYQNFNVYRDPNGNFSVTLYQDGGPQGTVYGPVQDNTYTANAYTAISINSSQGGSTSMTFGENLMAYVQSATFTSRGFDTELSTPVWGNFNVNLSSSADASLVFYTESSVDGVVWDSTVAATPGVQIASANKEWIRYKAVWTNSVSIATKTAALYSSSLNAASTGYFYSPVNFVGVDISSWDFLDVNNFVPNGSTITYSIRQATYSFPVTNTGIAWTTMSANSVIPLSISTPTYVQHQEYFQFNNADAVPTQNLVRVNWRTGLPVSSTASGFLNHRYFLCVAISSNINDTCLIQQRTRDWVIFKGQNIGAMSLFNNLLYGASGASDGSVWREMQDGVYTDAGVAIDAWWTSPDYTFAGQQFQDAGIAQKTVNEMWFDATPSSGTFLNIGYAVDKSTTFINKILDLSPPTMVNKRVPIDAGWLTGKYFRFRVENAQNATWRVNGLNIIGQFKARTDY